MDFKLANKITAGFVFLLSAIVYIITVQPTFSFWDCGEFIACAYTVGVPHPPGAPFFILMGKIFTLVPSASDIGLRMNYLSVLSSAGSVILTYLISVIAIKNWRGFPKTTYDVIVICGASAIGALALAFSDTFWFNALETEVYGLGTFLVALCVYLLMVWWEKADEKGSDKYLLLMAYVVGLAIGIHLLVVQSIIIAGLVFYFRRYEYTRKGLAIALGASAVAFFIVYPFIVKRIPELIQSMGYIGLVLVFGVLIAGIYISIQKKSAALNLLFMSIFLIVLGYSTYTSVLLRSGIPNLPIDENQPDDIEKLISYLNREQYGEQPLFLPRRYSQEPQHTPTWQNYTSDMDFMWTYQINKMFNRYLLWQFVGREGYDQNDGVDFSKLFAIPFILGLLGLFYQFKKDWRLAFVFLVMFLLMGVITALYQNQQDPQPRERDYFYVGAFMVFAMWIGFGLVAIIDQVIEWSKKNKPSMAVAGLVLAVGAIFAPLNMARVNYHALDRSGNYFPYNYAYNLLQSSEKDAIIFTNGDNDTFPLWCIQAVYGVRQDVRIVNLSLGQTAWYIKQLKNSQPYGSKTVPMTFTNEQIDRLAPSQWPDNKVMTLEIPRTAYPDSMQNNPELPTAINFVMPPTIRTRQGNQPITAIKTNDILVYDIIRANNWERPIYFSITVTDENYIGLNEYLVTEGMLHRLVPYKAVTETGLAVNEQVMKQCLFDSPDMPYKDPHYGFILKGLNDPSIFYNQDSERMIQTYRSLFMMLAESYSRNPASYPEVKTTLNAMETKIPRSVIPIDYRLKYQIAMMLYRIGDESGFKEWGMEALDAANKDIQANPMNMSGRFNPYIIAIDIYDAMGNYQAELEILKRVQAMNPQDPSVLQKIQEVETKMRGGSLPQDTLDQDGTDTDTN
jgi:hypothetical protein